MKIRVIKNIWLGVVSLAFLLSGCACISNDYGKSDETVINVASFNMLFIIYEPDHKEAKKYAHELKRWEIRKDRLIPLLEFHDVDICGSQELRPKQIEYLQNDVYASIVPSKDYHPNIWMNNVIWYKKAKYDVLESGTFNLKDKSKHRHCNWAKFRDKKTQAEFYFFNTHYPVGNEGGAMNSSMNLAENIKKITRGTPFIVVGDFNNHGGSDPIVYLEKSGMDDAKKISQTTPYGPNNTYQGFILKTPEWAKDLNAQIDFIFLSKGSFDVLKFGVITDNIDGMPPSDHFPIVSKLVLKR